MSIKITVFASFLACVLARPDSIPSYSAPAPHPPSYSAPAPSYSAPRPSYGTQEYPDSPAVYDAQYAVRDAATGNDYGLQETRNGPNTQGTYYVALPDGRIQKVTFYVDGESGYNAEVTYEGEAQYPPTKSYSPAPSYQ